MVNPSTVSLLPWQILIVRNGNKLLPAIDISFHQIRVNGQHRHHQVERLPHSSSSHAKRRRIEAEICKHQALWRVNGCFSPRDLKQVNGAVFFPVASLMVTPVFQKNPRCQFQAGVPPPKTLGKQGPARPSYKRDQQRSP